MTLHDNHHLPLKQVLQGDCIAVMNSLPPQSVDVIFADPPYNLQLQSALWRPNQTQVDAVTDAWDAFSDYAEYDAFTKAWLTAARRLASPFSHFVRFAHVTRIGIGR